MSGIYIHIPFCKSRCKYCDFYSTTHLNLREQYVDALLKEIELRKDYLIDKEVNTIYFGGGTPSLLSPYSIDLILRKLEKIFQVSPQAEITIETNPGDLTEEYLSQVKKAGVNRVSIGIQSFNDNLLELLGRRHTAQQAIEAVQQTRKAGFDNISIDLIYAIPGQTISTWQHDLQQAIDLNIEHISTYCLTYEEGTKMTQMLENGQIKAVNEEIQNKMYDILCNTLITNGFTQYEVSNFSKPNRHSQHNSAYWGHIPYLGLGAAAHSFDGKSRQWNIDDVESYIEQVRSSSLQAEKEILTSTDLYNEKIMLSLRTTTGLELSELNDQQKSLIAKAQPFIDKGFLSINDNRLMVTQEGFHILDYITRELMI